MENIKVDLEKGTLLPRTVLCKSKMMCGYEESSEYNDLKYYPFFYHLGKKITPNRILQIGAKGGLIANCFLQTCKSVVQWNYWMTTYSSTIQINTEMFLPHEFGIVRWLPELTKQDKFDLVLITEIPDDLKGCLEKVWKHLGVEGLLVVDYINEGSVKNCFDDFCRVENREAICYKTRYGTGILKR